jgi:hypothetical protein
MTTVTTPLVTRNQAFEKLTLELKTLDALLKLFATFPLVLLPSLTLAPSFLSCRADLIRVRRVLRRHLTAFESDYLDYLLQPIADRTSLSSLAPLSVSSVDFSALAAQLQTLSDSLAPSLATLSAKRDKVIVSAFLDALHSVLTLLQSFSH